MLNTIKIASAFVVAAMFIAACGRGDGDDKPRASDVGKIDNRTMSRTLKVDISGAHSISFSKDVEMRFLLRESKGDALAHSVASATLDAPLDVGNGLSILPEVAVVGMYKGDGTYTISAGSGTAPTTGPTAPPPGRKDTTSLSTVGMTVLKLAPPSPSETRFGYTLEACHVTLDERMAKGSAECPALVSVHGDRIALRMSWK